MARTSKTKVGGGPEQATMLRAAEAGAAAEAAARSEAIAQQERIGESVRGQIQAGAAGIAQEGIRREEAATQQRQFDTQTNLRAAEAGLRTNPEFERRQQQLREELERGERQSTAPAEFDGEQFIPTEARQQQEERELQIQESRVRVMQQNAMSRAVSAASKGDIDAYQEERKNYAGVMKSMIGIANKIIRGDFGKLTPSEKSEIADLARNNPDQELQREIQSGIYGPRTAELIRGKAFFDALPFVAIRGDFPDPDLIDYANPQYKEFVSTHIPLAKTILQQREAVGPIPGVNSIEDGQRILRQIAAISQLAAGFDSRNRASAKSVGLEESPELPSASMNPNAPTPPGGAPRSGPFTQPPTMTGGPVQEPGGWNQQH